jgi:dTDP-L-rhamnose 4-epimerase
MPLDPGTVLVTGGAGFIGCALSHQLAGRADRWVVVDNLHPQIHPRPARPAALHDAAELVVNDVVDHDAWDALLAQVRPDTVIHLAAETGTAQSLTESTRHGMVNVVGTTALLDAVTRSGHQPAHVLLTSSRAVYGEGTWKRSDGSTWQPGLRTHAMLAAGRWDHEDSTYVPSSVDSTPPAPASVYGATKLAQEHLLGAWSGSHDVALSVLRLQNVYGPGQSLSNPYTGIVSLFSRLAIDGQSIPLYEDGDITRDFVYIDDVATAIVAALSAAPAGGARTLDVGSGVRTTIRELATWIADHHGAPLPHVTGEFRDGDVRHAGCDITPTLEAIEWRPSWSLQDGLSALQKWIEPELAREARGDGQAPAGQ